MALYIGLAQQGFIMNVIKGLAWMALRVILALLWIWAVTVVVLNLVDEELLRSLLIVGFGIFAPVVVYLWLFERDST